MRYAQACWLESLMFRKVACKNVGNLLEIFHPGLAAWTRFLRADFHGRTHPQIDDTEVLISADTSLK